MAAPLNTIASPDRTRERLLEKAEELFAVHGFDNVSLRDLTQAAGTNVAAVNYHFGSREGLIDCLVGRLLNPINEERLVLLAEARRTARNGRPEVETILRAFLQPVVQRVRRTDLSEMLFFKLMGRCLADRAHHLPESALPLLQKVVVQFSKALQERTPDLDLPRILWRLNFTIGALIQTLLHGDLIERLSKGAVGTVNAEEMLEQLVEFCAAGFREPAPKRAVKLARVSKKPGALPPATAPRRALKLARVAKTVLFICSATLLLMSCQAVSPKSRMGELAVPVPGSWAASKEGRTGVDTDWVRRFHDAKLNAVVDEALRNNHDLKIAAARVERARAQVSAAGVAGNPTSDLTFQGERAKRNFIGFPLGNQPGDGGVSSSQSNSFGLTLDIKWEADIWGRIAAGKSAAAGQYEAAQQDERAARASIAATAAKAWFALVEAQAQLQLANESKAVYEQTATAVRERFKAGNHEGGGAAAQLRIAESDVATAAGIVADRQQQIVAATRQLEVILGRYPAGELKSAPNLPSVPSAPPAGLPSELLQRRPDVLAAERRLAAAGKSLTEARRALFPRLSLTANGGSSTDELAELLNSDFGVWQLAGNAIQPIFAGGAIRAEAGKRYADEKEALAQLQKTVLGAFGEVETALASDRPLAAREAALMEAARLAEEADKAARADYRDGVGDILTVLIAQNRYLLSRTQWLLVRRLRLENRVNLHLALGGDYQPKPAR